MKFSTAFRMALFCWVVTQARPFQGAQIAAPEATLPRVVIRPASLIQFPAATDCNSPAHWDGDTFYLFNSSPNPWRASGSDLFHLQAASETHYDDEVNGGRWIEASWKDPDGTLYGWYHNEPHPVCPSKPRLTAPRIGATRSRDDGAHWEDLGLVLEAPPYPLRCDTEDKYFAGGNGDFSVIADERREYLYFFTSTYHRNSAEQGIGVARMRYADRNDPVGKVWKSYHGQWTEPGIGGHVTPIIPVNTPWHRKDVHAFWGPSIHWNSHLKLYVILMNYAIDSNWTQAGIYVSFNHALSESGAWTQPREILDRQKIVDSEKDTGWYPQVIGIDKSLRETDKLAGKLARLFIAGRSRWEILFLQSNEDK